MIRAYYPKPLFPPVSLSDGCMLMCKHCMGRYLDGMVKITEPEKLVEFCKGLEERGGKGILVSGGSDADGRIIGLEKSVDALKKIRKETDLVVAVHAGYVDRATAEELADACDIAFVDMVGSDETARQVIGIGISKYTETLSNLMSGGIPTTPHITIGLHYGRIEGEYSVLESLRDFPVKKIVLNVIVPTRGTYFEGIDIPDMGEIEDIIKKARGTGAEVALGCMRPRRMREIERIAIDNGVRDLAVLSGKSISYAQENGHSVEKVQACCGLSDELIKKVLE